MYGEYKAKIVDQQFRIGKALYLFARVGQKTEVLYSNETKTFDEGVDIEPTLVLSTEQLQALANELDNLGYHPQKEYVEGKLEATEAHLKDMRALLKLK